MEKIAISVAYGKSPKNLEERQLYQLLGGVLSSSLKCTKDGRRRLPLPTSKSKLAWIQLRSLYSSEIISSLIARTREHVERI